MGRRSGRDGASDPVRGQARQVLPRFLFDYIDGGAGAEQCLARNRRDLDAIGLLARPLGATALPDCRTMIGGQVAAMPLAIAPTGLNDLVRPGGDVALARAAAGAAVPFIQSGASLTAYADLCAGDGAMPWYQIYVHDLAADIGRIELMLDRGCRDLIVTVDVPTGGIRHRDIANRFGPRLSGRMAWQAMLRPAWLCRAAAARIAPPVPRQSLPPAIAHRRFDDLFGWAELARLRAAWRGRLWVKGIVHPDDARRAVAAGVDGIIVSNHGGRQLDLAPSAWQMLPAVRAVVAADFPVLADGGVRSGEDIARAVALGASAVLIGRPVLWALAVDGGKGVARLLDRLQRELVVTMRLLGCANIGDLASVRPVRLEAGEAFAPDRAGWPRG